MTLNRRDFLRSVSLGTACIGAGCVASPFGGADQQGAATKSRGTPARARVYWYDQYTLNEEAAAFGKYDPERITDELMSTGADIIVLYAANQFSVAYYPSSIWPQHPNLRGRDYFGELLSRLRARGKKVVAYVNWLESRHPEWNSVRLGSEASKSHEELPLASWAKPEDREWRVQRVPGGQWIYPCVNSPRRNQVLAAAREIVERYKPDGFSLDMFHANGILCVCDYCRPYLEEICGTREINLAAVSAHWRAFVDWRCERSSSFIRELSAILRHHGVLACHNSATPLYVPAVYGPGEDWIPHLDVSVSEIFSSVHVPCLTVRLQHALGLTSWELLTSTAPLYAHRSIPTAWWRINASTCKANGAEVLGPCGVGAYPDTTSSRALLDTVKTGLDFFMEDADLSDGAVSAAKIAVVFSWATRKYFKDGAMNWSEEITGWCRLLIEEHLPFDFVVAEKLTSAADLLRYDLVVLPNTANTSEAFGRVIRDYVSRGGRLLAVGETSRFDERGWPRADFDLHDVLGVASKGSSEGPFAIQRPGEPEPATGVLQHVATSATVLCHQVAVDPAGSVTGVNDPLPIAPTQWPVLVENRFGRGQALYVAFDIGRLYCNQVLPHIARIMAQAIDGLVPDRQVVVKAPRSVEVTVYRQEAMRRTILHLADLTQAAADVSRLTETIPVPDVEVALRVAAPPAAVACRGSEISTRVADGRVWVRLAKLDSYAAVLFESPR